MNDYEMAVKLYGDKFWEAGRGRAWIISTMNRSMCSRPDVFITFIYGGRSGRYQQQDVRRWALTDEALKALKGEDEKEGEG